MTTTTYDPATNRGPVTSGWKNALTTYRSKVGSLLAIAMTLVALGNSAEAVTIVKHTRFEQLSATPLVVQNGNPLTLKARLTYRDKNHNWVYLGYTSVPVTLLISGRPEAATMTNRADGFATFQITANYSGKIPVRGKTIQWKVTFAGDNELNRASRYSSFKIVK